MLNKGYTKHQKVSYTAKIFYGAGQNARDNIAHWINSGLFPDSFADNDPSKHHTVFPLPSGKGIEILPLLEAIERYPDYEIYITLIPQNLKETTQYLIRIGIPKARIKYCEPYELRLGCGMVGKMFLIADKLGTCCVPGHPELGTALGSDAEENYLHYTEYCDGIIENWRSNVHGACEGCPHLQFDIWRNNPRHDIGYINISSKEGEDYCNVKCKYCNLLLKPSSDSLEKRKKEVIDCLQFFARRFQGEHFEVVLSGGEIAVAPYRKDAFEIIAKNNWAVQVYTNGVIYCEEITEILRAGRGTVWITLDSTIPEKYAEMKGVDCLSKVMQNIRRYAETAKCKHDIRLKVIISDEDYRDFDELKGVVDFAAEIDATLLVSCNVHTIPYPLSPLALGLTVMFIRYALAKRLNLTIMYDHFNPIDADFLKKLV